jgi:hypothetical protein
MLSIDVTTLEHMAVGARGLVRFRIDGTNVELISFHTTLSGNALPAPDHPSLGVVAVTITPDVPGIHELAGELRAKDASGETRYTFKDVYVRVAAAGPQVNIVNIDQSHARVVDNSRSSFGGGEKGGLVGDGDWHPIPLTAVREVAPTPRPPPHVDFAVKTDKATYCATSVIASGDISTVYGAGDVVLKIADAPSDNDLMQHETRVLGLLLAHEDKTTIHFVPPRDQFRTADGRLGTVFERLEGFDLTALRDRFKQRGEPGLPPRHLIWVLRRALAALGWAHKNGILHGNLDPSHILVRGRDHMVWLVDWCWAVVNPEQTVQGFKALNETYSPPEVAERGKPTPASDIYALGKCAIHLVGGDPATKTLPDNMDPKLARFIKYMCVESQGGRAQDAWELYLQIDRIRQQIWGAHEFIPLEI